MDSFQTRLRIRAVVETQTTVTIRSGVVVFVSTVTSSSCNSVWNPWRMLEHSVMSFPLMQEMTPSNIMFLRCMMCEFMDAGNSSWKLMVYYHVSVVGTGEGNAINLVTPR